MWDWGVINERLVGRFGLFLFSLFVFHKSGRCECLLAAERALRFDRVWLHEGFFRSSPIVISVTSTDPV